MSFLRPLTRSARDGVGQPVLRKDDARLLVGAGVYSDDVNVPGQAYACFVRSPHAHADVGRIETAAARSTPGPHGLPRRRCSFPSHPKDALCHRQTRLSLARHRG